MGRESSSSTQASDAAGLRVSLGHAPDCPKPDRQFSTPLTLVSETMLEGHCVYLPHPKPVRAPSALHLQQGVACQARACTHHMLQELKAGPWHLSPAAVCLQLKPQACNLLPAAEAHLDTLQNASSLSTCLPQTQMQTQSTACLQCRGSTPDHCRRCCSPRPCRMSSCGA